MWHARPDCWFSVLVALTWCWLGQGFDGALWCTTNHSHCTLTCCLFECLQDTALSIAAMQRDAGLECDDEVYLDSFKPTLMDVFYDWSLGKSFAEVRMHSTCCLTWHSSGSWEDFDAWQISPTDFKAVVVCWQVGSCWTAWLLRGYPSKSSLSLQSSSSLGLMLSSSSGRSSALVLRRSACGPLCDAVLLACRLRPRPTSLRAASSVLLGDLTSLCSSWHAQRA